MATEAPARHRPGWLPRSPAAELREVPHAVRRGLGALFTRPSGRPDTVLGVVIGLALAGPLVFGQATGRAAAGSIAALTALNTALALASGPAWRRLGTAVVAALVNSAALAVGAWAAEPEWLAPLIVLVVTPALVLSGLRSETGRAISIPATLTFIVGVGLPAAPAGERFVQGLAGGGWALALLALAILFGLLASPPPPPAAPAGVLANHAIRLGLAAAIAVALASALSLAHGYWLAIAVAVVLRPGLDATAERVAQRVAGTLLGGVLGAVVIEQVDDVWALIVIAVLLVGGAAAMIATDYRIASLLLTAGVLAMLDAGHPISVGVVNDRLLSAAVGAALALVALVLWPEPPQEPVPAGS